MPGSRAIAAAAALDAALTAGYTAEEAVAASENAAKALGGAVVFITASATLMVQVSYGGQTTPTVVLVRHSFHEHQCPACRPDQTKQLEGFSRRFKKQMRDTLLSRSNDIGAPAGPQGVQAHAGCSHAP